MELLCDLGMKQELMWQMGDRAVWHALGDGVNSGWSEASPVLFGHGY